MAGEHVLTFTDADFNQEVLSSQEPVLVDFWATWCGPCKMIAPVVSDVADDYAGQVKVGKVNVDENTRVPAEYGIMSIPTLLIFNKGELIQRVVGYKPKDELVKLLKTVL
ncbi:MAG: thioredoxin [Bacillota bacterium]